MKGQPARKVVVNGVMIGKAKTWHEAEQRLFEFADELFEPAATRNDFDRATDRKLQRCRVFLRAMGVDDPARWKRNNANSDEVGNCFKFIFSEAGRFLR